MRELKRKGTTIEGERVYLRVLEESDATDRYAEWLNDATVNAYLETRATTVEQLREYIRAKRTSDQCLFFGIFWKEHNQHIGNVKLEPIDQKTGVATMGILIGEKDFWGRGIATEVINMITQYVFDTLGLSEVNLGVISENAPAIRVYEKCGFVVYRVDPHALNREGKWYDNVYMRKRKF